MNIPNLNVTYLDAHGNTVPDTDRAELDARLGEALREIITPVIIDMGPHRAVLTWLPAAPAQAGL